MGSTFSLPRMGTRKNDAHKGDFGRVLVVAGSKGMVGAACLAAQAALSSGSGLVWAATPCSVQPQAAIKLTCAMTVPLAETRAGTVSLSALDKVLSFPCDALLVGPGLGRNPETDLFVQALVREAACPTVVDADGLTALAMDPGCLSGAPAPRILTPHPGEMARLGGLSVSEIQSAREATAADLARRTGAVVVLKGHGTVVTDGDRSRVNTTGNPGMATAGSGDVLAGIVASLAGQGYGALEAAGLAVHIHGLAGDAARDRMGETSLTAEDILHGLAEAFLGHGS
jgi:NAD(P)H-hydrate epimerase